MPNGAKDGQSTMYANERIVQVPRDLQEPHIDNDKPADPIRHPLNDRRWMTPASTRRRPGRKQAIPGQVDPGAPTQVPGQGLGSRTVNWLGE
jgi:hypothetical protein